MSLGDYELDVSLYEDTATRKPWKMNLSKLNMLKPGVEGKPGWGVGAGLDPAGGVAGGRVLACSGWESELKAWSGLTNPQRCNSY